MDKQTIKTKSAGGVVVNQEGKVLVVDMMGSIWGLPKGHLEEGEDMLTAAKREIYEESGVKELNLIKELGTYSRYRVSVDKTEDHSEMKEITMFLFTTTQMELGPIDPDNHDAIWVDRDKVADKLWHEKDKNFYKSILGELPPLSGTATN